MIFGSKQRPVTGGSKEEIAHEVWTRSLFEKVAKSKEFEVDILEVTKTVSTVGRDRGARGVSLEINDGLLANILRPPVRAGIYFDSENAITLLDGSRYTAEQGVGYYWLHSGVVTGTGEKVLQKFATNNPNVSSVNKGVLPRAYAPGDSW